MRRLALLPALGAMIFPACVIQTGDTFAEPRTFTESVPLEPVEVVHTEIHMPAGELRVSGGTADLMDGEFIVTSENLEPTVHYESSGVQGHVVIEPLRRRDHGVGYNGTNRWVVRLNDEVPTDLDLQMGAGDTRLELAGMTLREVNMEMGVGKCELDLVSEWDRNLDVRIKGGIGELKVRVPNHIGVIASARGGIGEINVHGLKKRNGKYVNDAYGESPVTISLDLQGGIGEISVVAVD